MFQNRRTLSTINSLGSNILVAGAHSVNTFGTIQTTSNYNSQFNNIYNNLSELRNAAQLKVNSLPHGDTSMRNTGTNLAWRYEKAEIELGGKGTTKWGPEQRQELLENGKVRGAEGHHINNVKDSPQHQANPDNIKFARSKNEHLNSEEFHGGNTKEPTHGEMFDRNTRLENANMSRVIKNELKGIGIAAAIGLGVGFTIGFITSIAQNGYTMDAVRNAFISGGKLALESSILGATNHIALRAVGAQVSSSISNVLVNNFGFSLTENLIKVSNMATAGIFILAIYSAVIFTRLKLSGYDTKQALVVTAKSLIMPLAVLVISIIAQSLWAGHAGLIVSISIGVTLMAYQLVKTEHDKKILNQIRYFSINKMKPSFT